MPKPQIKIHNAETGEIIIRDMNAEELAIYNKETAEFNAMQAEIAEKASAKAALLSRLGITEDEAKLLLS
jgi:predicted GIY-YIG superfamily endonuclease